MGDGRKDCAVTARCVKERLRAQMSVSEASQAREAQKFVAGRLCLAYWRAADRCVCIPPFSGV